MSEVLEGQTVVANVLALKRAGIMAHDTATDCIGHASGLARSGAPGSLPIERNERLAIGPSLVHASSLLGALERAQFHIMDLVEHFDALPEAYEPSSNLWQRYDELRQACETISDAHNQWIGD